MARGIDPTRSYDVDWYGVPRDDPRECWCPDTFRDRCIPVDYCPRHGKAAASSGRAADTEEGAG